MATKQYTIDWDKLTSWLIPKRFASALLFARALVEPFKIGYVTKRSWQDDLRYKLAHTSQVIYLEKVLNEYYEVADYDADDHVATRTIRIDAGTKKTLYYVYPESDDKPVWVETASGTKYMYTEEILAASYFDFILKVPSALTYDEDELRGIIDFYKNTKQYKIETY